MKLSTVVVLVFTAVLFVSTEAKSKADVDEDWWKHAVFYQIYPRSFKDSDGDGVGDLQGIISKLDHLKDAGITATWLSPIYTSPQVDQGYDISDFTNIHYEYGTLEDFDQLIEKANELGIKIIMDLVPNHSSDQHEWFNKSVHSVRGYEDYYVWKDAVNGSEPNNWISIFKDAAWTYNSVREQYYLHQFAEAQPDLNYRSAALVKEMKDAMTFWLDRGVAGFRVDAVPYLFEHESFKDEPLSGDETAGETDYEYLTHIYTKDQPETYDMIYQFRELVDNYTAEKGEYSRILMTEAYTDIENTMLFYGTSDGSRLGAQFTFNFEIISYLDGTSSARDFVDIINKWLAYMPVIYTPNWVVGNHDQRRVATRHGPQNVDGFNMLVTLLPGVGVTYNGEEIGQEDGEVTFEEGADPSACKNESIYDEVTRDYERTPFQWDNTKNAGFSTANKTWLPVSSKYLETNLAAQSVNGTVSHYHVYQDLLKLRQEAAFASGKLTIKALSDNTLAFTRTLTGSDGYVVVFNIGNSSETVDLTAAFSSISSKINIVIASIASTRKVGDSLDASKLHIDGHEALVAKIETTSTSTSTSTSSSTSSTTSSSTTSSTTSSSTTSSTTSSSPEDDSDNGAASLHMVSTLGFLAVVYLLA